MHVHIKDEYTLDLIRCELNQLEHWKTLHVHREYNEAAHLFASLEQIPTSSLDWISAKVDEWL